MTHLIDKDALVAWIRSRLHPVVVQHETNYDDWDRGADSERLNILSFLDTLEVKEVDLEKEILNYIGDEGSCKHCRWTWYECHEMIRYFFELGLKAQKGE